MFKELTSNALKCPNHDIGLLLQVFFSPYFHYCLRNWVARCVY